MRVESKYVWSVQSIALITLLVLMQGFSSVHAHQSDSGEATPATTSEELVAPRFALIPVGDHPDGYFSTVKLEPGTSTQLAVAVVNVGEVPADLYTYKANALSGVNGGFVPGHMDDPDSGATAWIDYMPDTLTLVPNSEQVIEFSVAVPPNTSPGQYLSALVVETKDSLSIQGTEDLRQVLAHSITIEIIVPGELVTSLELGNPEIVVTAQSSELQIPISNTGNYLVRPIADLSLSDGTGRNVLSSSFDLGSIYGGLSTYLSVPLAEQLPSGDYSLNLTLTDPESGATDSIEGATVTVPEPVDPTGVSVATASVEPNAEDIVFANIDVTLNNGGQQIPASDVTLEVLRDGQQVDEFPLATNQVLLNGENTYTTRYIPADMWESGTYTFRIVVSAVDPNGGQETILLTEDLDAEIVVP